MPNKADTAGPFSIIWTACHLLRLSIPQRLRQNWDREQSTFHPRACCRSEGQKTAQINLVTAAKKLKALENIPLPTSQAGRWLSQGWEEQMCVHVSEQFRPASFTHMSNPYCVISPTAVMREERARLTCRRRRRGLSNGNCAEIYTAVVLQPLLSLCLFHFSQSIPLFLLFSFSISPCSKAKYVGKTCWQSPGGPNTLQAGCPAWQCSHVQRLAMTPRSTASVCAQKARKEMIETSLEGTGRNISQENLSPLDAPTGYSRPINHSGYSVLFSLYSWSSSYCCLLKQHM